MIRLMGGIVGSALAIALLLLLVGIPQFRAPADEPEPAVMTLPLRTTPVDDATTIEEAPVDDEPSTPPDDAVFASASAVSDTLSATDEEAEQVLEAPLEGAGPASFESAAIGEPQWYTFWSPFRSEVAASGFVARLQSVTGLDYRIVRREAGVYEVAFAYRDDDEIVNNLSHITAATGLELAGR